MKKSLIALLFIFISLISGCNHAEPEIKPALSGRFEGPIGSIEFFADNTFEIQTQKTKFDGVYEFIGRRVTLYTGARKFLLAFDSTPDGELISNDGSYKMRKVNKPGQFNFKAEQ